MFNIYLPSTASTDLIVKITIYSNLRVVLLFVCVKKNSLKLIQIYNRHRQKKV